MKLTWLSNSPWFPTGYGNQTALFVPRLQKKLGHELAVIAFAGLQGGILYWTDEMPVYPSGFDPYGNDVVAAHSMHFGADVCISLMDAWVNQPEAYGEIKWIPWFPVDHEPLPVVIRNQVKQAYKRIVFSKFAEKQLKNSGLDCYYVPHGVDTGQFIPIDRKVAIEQLPWMKGHEDKFIVGMVAANKGNPSRKAFPENLEAFRRLKEKHSDVFLYLHTNKSLSGEMDGVNLPEFLDLIGLEEDVDYAFVHQYMYMLGLSTQYMNSCYNVMDVHLLVSYGEGFGIPIVEAQAAGTPVIVGDWTSMGELCFSGWKVPKETASPLYTPLASYQFKPTVDAIYEALEKAYRMKGNLEYRKAARAGSLAYDADKITTKYWKTVLEEIEKSL